MSKFISSLILVLTFVLSSCTQYPNLSSFPIKHEGCRKFVVIQGNPSDSLAFVDDENQLHVIRNDINAAYGRIYQIIPSPDQTKVIIISYGEGAQTVNIFLVAELIKEYGDPNRSVPTISTLSPFPNDIFEVRWRDNDQIEFTSAGDYTKFTHENRDAAPSEEAAPDDPGKKWLWNIEQDTMTLLSRISKNN